MIEKIMMEIIEMQQDITFKRRCQQSRIRILKKLLRSPDSSLRSKQIMQNFMQRLKLKSQNYGDLSFSEAIPMPMDLGEPIALEMYKGEPIPLGQNQVDEEEMRSYIENNVRFDIQKFEGK